MYFNYDNTVTIETTGKDHAGAATWALCDIVEGKAFVDDRCIQSIGRGCKPLSEGMRLFFADDPDDVPDTDISIIPFLSDDGRAMLKVLCRSTGGDGAEEESTTVGSHNIPVVDLDSAANGHQPYKEEDEWPF